MRRLKLKQLSIALLILMNVSLLMAQTETFPRYRLVGGTSGVPIEVDSTNHILSTLTGTSAQADTGLASTLPRFRLAGGVTGNIAEVDSTGHLLIARSVDTGTVTSSATPTINTNTVRFFSITAQTTDITSFTTNLSGSPTEAQTLWIAITGTGARAITWGASFEASTIALPTTTVSTNRLDVGFVYNTVTGKWRCIAVA